MSEEINDPQLTIDVLKKEIVVLLEQRNQRDNKIAALEAEAGELRKDKERLDWLDYRKTNHYAHWSEDGWNGPFVSWSVSHVLMNGSYTFPNELIEMNVRSAIDTALNSTKGEK